MAPPLIDPASTVVLQHAVRRWQAESENAGRLATRENGILGVQPPYDARRARHELTMSREFDAGNGQEQWMFEGLTPEQQYPGVRPELARILAMLDRQNEEILARMEREALERQRRPGLMGRLFGLETHVID